MATIQDVAKLAGVSTATVSRVLNNNYRVSDSRRQQVLDAVKALNYHPNIIGRNLSRSENRTILVVSSGVHNLMLSGIHYAATQAGYDIILSYAPSAAPYVDAFKYVRNGLAGGLLLCNYFASDSSIQELAGQYPLVMCNEHSTFPGANYVSVHDADACYELTSLLIEQGHRRFAFFGSSASTPDFNRNYARSRKQGFINALNDHRLPLIPELITDIDRPIEYSERQALAHRYVEMPPELRPDVIVCDTDTSALSCVISLSKSGIVIPDEIAIAGFDNAREACLCFPNLTTVDQPFFEIGAESARLLIAIMSGEVAPVDNHIYLEHTIVTRGSTEKGLE